MKRPFGRGPTTLLMGRKLTMVINHLLSGMILQVTWYFDLVPGTNCLRFGSSLAFHPSHTAHPELQGGCFFFCLGGSYWGQFFFLDAGGKVVGCFSVRNGGLEDVGDVEDSGEQ